MKKLMTSRNLITRILCFLLIFTLLSGSFAFGETNDDLITDRGTHCRAGAAY